MSRKITFIITRQDGPDATPYKETFKLDYRPNMNVIGALMEIQRNPVNAEGKRVAPVVWEMSCLEEVCGAGIWENLLSSGFYTGTVIGLLIFTLGFFFLVPISLFMAGRLPLWAMIVCFPLGVIWLAPLPDMVVTVLYSVPLFLMAWGFSQSNSQKSSSRSAQSSVNS